MREGIAPVYISPPARFLAPWANATFDAVLCEATSYLLLRVGITGARSRLSLDSLRPATSHCVSRNPWHTLLESTTVPAIAPALLIALG